MVRKLVIAAFVAAGLVALTAHADPPPPPSKLPACIRVATESRWVPYGYNHIVIIEDGCSKAATCSVATDVNPQAQSADVASGQTIEVNTFMASASSTFVAKVTCTLH